MKKPSSTKAAVSPREDKRPEAQRPEAVLRRLRQRFEHIPAGVSLADELLSERRAESGREE
jgi:hypothetical protein